MLGTQKRKYILGGSQNRTDPNKRSKLQTPDTDSDDETDDEEKDLEAFLFGGNSNLLEETIEESSCNSHDNVKEKDTEDNFLGFTISTKPDDDNAPKEDDIQFLVNKEESKAAWSDDDDANVKVDISSVNRIKKLKEHTSEKQISGNKFQQRLKSQFEKILPTPAWADLENASVNNSALDFDDAEGNILLSSKRAIVKSKELPQGILSISKLKNLNQLKASSSTITSLEFHPHSKIAFTTSLNKRLNIFQADGRENRKLQSIFLANFPIYTGHFTPDGGKVVATSRRKFFYVYDLLEGKVAKVPEIRGCDEKSLENFQVSPDGEIIAFLGNSGYINLVSSKTFHLISSLKMNGGILTATFSSEGSRLYSAGSDGEVYIWNIRQRKCEHRFIDDGSLKTKSIAVSRDQKYIATGSTSGIVNIYDEQCLTQKYPNPIRILKNLTTSVDGVSFNSTRFDINFEQWPVNFQSDLDEVKIDAESEILGYYSPQARNSIRLLHFPSLTNFSNWPIERQTLGNVSCIGFSPSSGYMGVGNEKGQALLFRLKHYPSS